MSRSSPLNTHAGRRRSSLKDYLVSKFHADGTRPQNVEEKTNGTVYELPVVGEEGQTLMKIPLQQTKSYNSPVVADLPSGTKFHVVELGDHWAAEYRAKVVTEKGIEGWLSTRSLRGSLIMPTSPFVGSPKGRSSQSTAQISPRAGISQIYTLKAQSQQCTPDELCSLPPKEHSADLAARTLLEQQLAVVQQQSDGLSAKDLQIKGLNQELLHAQQQLKEGSDDGKLILPSSALGEKGCWTTPAICSTLFARQRHFKVYPSLQTLETAPQVFQDSQLICPGLPQVLQDTQQISELPGQSPTVQQDTDDSRDWM